MTIQTIPTAIKRFKTPASERVGMRTTDEIASMRDAARAVVVPEQEEVEYAGEYANSKDPRGYGDPSADD